MQNTGYSHTYTLRFDGGAAPTNPGPCAGSYVIYEYNQNGTKNIIAEGGKYIDNGTNNYGEYIGLIEGLKKSIELGIESLFVEGDSLLVICQMTGKWKVKNEKLYELFTEAIELVKQFKEIVFNHILRQYNFYADSLYNKTLLLKKTW